MAWSIYVNENTSNWCHRIFPIFKPPPLKQAKILVAPIKNTAFVKFWCPNHPYVLFMNA